MATTRHRLPVRDMLAIERRPTHLCLWRHYLEREILLHFFRLFIFVVCGSSRMVFSAVAKEKKGFHGHWRL